MFAIPLVTQGEQLAVKVKTTMEIDQARTVADTEKFISVEGTWSIWGPFGVCSGTCDITATHNRTRNYTGGTMPCAGNATEVAIGCQGEHCSKTLNCSHELIHFS